MSDDRGRSIGSYAGWGLGGLVIVDFGFPALWYWPIWKVYGLNQPQWLETLFSPLVWLMEQFPIYRHWVLWGYDLLGIK